MELMFCLMIEVMLQAGFKFSDADLLGMPIQIIVGERGLKENQVEVENKINR